MKRTENVEMQKRILLTAFRNTSADLLLKEMKGYKTLLLPNDKVKDSEKLIKEIINEPFDFVISLGQRPNIKNKVHIETTARDGVLEIHTDFDVEGLKGLFEEKGVFAKISHNVGTSFCNKLYWSGLRFIGENALGTKMVFVHIPVVKNIEDVDWFRQVVAEVLENLMK